MTYFTITAILVSVCIIVVLNETNGGEDCFKKPKAKENEETTGRTPQETTGRTPQETSGRTRQESSRRTRQPRESVNDILSRPDFFMPKFLKASTSGKTDASKKKEIVDLPFKPTDALKLRFAEYKIKDEEELKQLEEKNKQEMLLKARLYRSLGYDVTGSIDIPSNYQDSNFELGETTGEGSDPSIYEPTDEGTDPSIYEPTDEESSTTLDRKGKGKEKNSS